MAIPVAGDTGAYYRNQTDVDDDTPVSAVFVTALDEPLTVATILVLDEPPYFVGPVVAPNVTTTDTPASVGSIPSANQYVLPPAVQNADANALAAGLASAEAVAIANGSLIPWALTTGVDPGLWDFADGIWSERFGNRPKMWERGISTSRLTTIYARVIDVADLVGGKLTMSVDWTPRTTDPGKTYTLPESVESAGTGVEQVLTLSPTLQPAGSSEMRLEFTTGSTNAPPGGPFYQVLQIWPEFA